MSSAKKPRSAISPWTFVAFVLLAADVGLYYATVERNWYSRGGYWCAHYKLPQGDQYPSLWTKPFAPIHWIDRQMRPDLWRPKTR